MTAGAVQSFKRRADRRAGLMDRLHPYRVTLFAAPAALTVALVGTVYLDAVSITWFWFAMAGLVPAVVVAIVLFDASKRL
jgi:hypothetical protein